MRKAKLDGKGASVKVSVNPKSKSGLARVDMGYSVQNEGHKSLMLNVIQQKKKPVKKGA